MRDGPSSPAILSSRRRAAVVPISRAGSRMIVTAVGEIVAIEEREVGVRLRVASSYDPDGIDMGASIAHAGCCLTVVDKGRLPDGRGWHEIEASPETLRCTTMGDWKVMKLASSEPIRPRLKRANRTTLARRNCKRGR